MRLEACFLPGLCTVIFELKQSLLIRLSHEFRIRLYPRFYLQPAKGGKLVRQYEQFSSSATATKQYILKVEASRHNLKVPEF